MRALETERGEKRKIANVDNERICGLVGAVAHA
jgi:hypothetical protein